MASHHRLILGRLIVGLLIGALALGLALWGVPLGALAEALGRARVAWLLPVAGLFFLQQLLRSARQAILLHGATGEAWPLSLRDSLSVLCVSFLFINTLPARIGEVVRPTLLWERHRVPLGRGVAMVFFERAVDLASAIGMLALVALFVPTPSRTVLVAGRALDLVEIGTTAATVVLPLVLGGLLAVMLGASALARLLSPRVAGLPAWARRPAGLLSRFAAGFAEGLAPVRRPSLLLAVLGLTGLTWSLSGLMFVCSAHAFHADDLIGYGQGVGLLSVTMLGTVVPSAPGFAGTYEAFLRGGLALFGVAGPGRDADALAFALVHHWWVYGVQACTAIYFLAVDQVSPRALWRRAMESWRSS